MLLEYLWQLHIHSYKFKIVSYVHMYTLQFNNAIEHNYALKMAHVLVHKIPLLYPI